MSDDDLRAARPRAERTTPPTTAARDPDASPLGRGADAGPIDSTAPLSSSSGETAGLRGAHVPGARAGHSGTLARENEDVDPRERRLD